MDRAAKLAAEARVCLRDEEAMQGVLSADANRKITRGYLGARARRLGLSEFTEISAAIDEALTAAGATP